ncbi:hypothetical protein [Mesorhizobium sp. L-8-3]|uniref:hypothetical protein n=1 Tax=Mesorhizobium sp. L-8-3 TaxID=2744522 RepID=UPI001928785A|nr:hypothetical protein [Mesorhizobium sp. L-8-3]
MQGFAAFFQAVRDTWHRYSCPENDRSGPGRRGPVARKTPDDLGAWRSEFRLPAGNGGSELRLYRMMEAFRVNGGELEQDYPRMLRDAEIACMRCRSKRRCFRELEAGTAAKNAEHFCPNADLLMIFADERNDPLCGPAGGRRQ